MIFFTLNTYVVFVGKRRRSSIFSGMGSFASLALIGSIGSQPELDRDSTSSEEEDDTPTPTASDIQKANQMLRSVSTDSGLSDTVSFSLSPDPCVGNGGPVFAYDNIDYKLTDEVNNHPFQTRSWLQLKIQGFVSFSFRVNYIYLGWRYTVFQRKRKRFGSVLWQKPLYQQKCQKGKVTT